MEVRCPKCGRVIDPKDVNVARDIAACLDCNEVFTLSELVGTTGGAGAGAPASGRRAVDLDDPPPGCSFRRTPDGFQVIASTRSWGAAVAIPFALAWNGFVVFLVVSLVSAALGGDGAVPAGPGENPEAVARPVAEPHDGPAAPANGDAEPAESPAEAAKTGLPWFVPVIGGVFLVPFVAVGLYELCMVVMLVCGEERVSVRQDRGEVFSGAGALGRRRTFDWGSVRRVTQWSHSVPFGIGLPGASRIVLEGGRRIVFGKSLGAERAAFVGSALAAMLAERDGRQRGTF